MYIMCSFLQLFQMPVSLLNGSAIFTNRLYFWYAVPLSLLSCDIILSVWLITGPLSIFLVILLQIGDGIDQSWFSGCIPAFAGILAVASTWQHSSCFLMFIFHNYLGTCLISANILSYQTWWTYRDFLRADRQEVIGRIWLRSSVKRPCRNLKQILNPWEILYMLASGWEKCSLRNLSCPVTLGF